MARIPTAQRLLGAHKKIQYLPFYKVFTALGDVRRIFIFCHILEHGEACVSEIAALCDMSVSAASQQLSRLERGGLIVRLRDKQRVCYRINKENTLASRLASIMLHE